MKHVIPTEHTWKHGIEGCWHSQNFMSKRRQLKVNAQEKQAAALIDKAAGRSQVKRSLSCGVGECSVFEEILYTSSGKCTK